ncbi:hypothetical protein ACXET9_14365 [Brachybacterium sp. DNPG3]
MSTVDRPGGEEPGGDDIDAEFARMMEGLDLTDAPLTVDDVLSAASEETGGAAEPAIAVVATSVATAQSLAGAIRLGVEGRTDGLDIPAGTRTVDTDMGAVAVGPHSEQLAHDLAAITSTALQRAGIVLFWRQGDRMTATRYRNGERGEDVSPAIVLGAVDDVVEQLLLGAVGLDEVGEGHDPAALTRAEALKWVSRRRKR